MLTRRVLFTRLAQVLAALCVPWKWGKKVDPLTDGLRTHKAEDWVTICEEWVNGKVTTHVIENDGTMSFLSVRTMPNFPYHELSLTPPEA